MELLAGLVAWWGSNLCFKDVALNLSASGREGCCVLTMGNRTRALAHLTQVLFAVTLNHLWGLKLYDLKNLPLGPISQLCCMENCWPFVKLEISVQATVLAFYRVLREVTRTKPDPGVLETKTQKNILLEPGWPPLSFQESQILTVYCLVLVQ